MARYQKAPDPLPAVKSIQSGYIFTSSTPLSGGGAQLEDRFYLDVTVAAVNPDRCEAEFFGGASNNTAPVPMQQTGSGAEVFRVLARMVSPTTLRLSFHASLSNGGLQGRWRVVEYN